MRFKEGLLATINPLADQLVTAGAARLGKLVFGRLVEAFGRLRVE